MAQIELTEDAKPGPGQKWLVDSLPIALQLVEDGTSGGRVIVRGEFARSGAATENKRVYPESLWEREIQRLSPAMQERKLYGELDHPNDGRTQLSRVSHVVTGMQLADNGDVMGEAEVLDTARGKDLKALLQAGCKVGVSSRGYGSTRTNDKGEEVVQEDYNLVTFDFVAEPADSTAYPDVYSEDKETGMGTQAQREDDQAKAKAFAAKVEQEAQAQSGADDLRAQFESDIIANLGKLSAEAREKIKAELESDPRVAGAKEAVERIVSVLKPFMRTEQDGDDEEGDERDARIADLENKIKEQELQIKEGQQEIASLSKLAREAGYKFYLERSLRENPDRDLVMKLVGDLAQYENAEALKNKVGGILGEMKARQEAEAARQAEIEQREEELRRVAEQERSRSKEIESGLKEDVTKLTEALEKALEANKVMGLQLYAEQRLNGHPQKKNILRLVEATGVGSKEEVDQIIEEHRIPDRDPDDLEAVRARARQATQGARSATTPTEEETPRPAPRRTIQEDYNGLGVGLDALKHLSGMNGRGN
jgi:hypothetical protein